MTVAGVQAVLCFGFCSVLIAQRLRRDRPELVLHDPDAYLARARRES
ncbi:hypothetical protein ABZ848_41905 [Streptomyces sp. NPDC047081]